MTSGNYVTAFLDGKVIESRNNVPGYSEALAAGNYVKIDHGNALFFGEKEINIAENLSICKQTLQKAKRSALIKLYHNLELIY